MKKVLALIWGYLRHNFMSAMAYRGAFFLQLFGMFLNDVMLLFFWAVLFSRLPTLNGWDLTGVMMIYAVTAFGVGLGTVVCGNADRVARIIATGGLDYYLALPADPLLHLLVSRMSLSAWGDLLFGLGLFLVAAPASWLHLPLFLFVGTLASAIFVAFCVSTGALAFWLGNAETLAGQLYGAILAFSLYPVDIFPAAVRLLLYTLIPAAFVGSLPARLLSRPEGGQLALLVAVAVMVTLASRWLFEQGLRRYESGNLVTVRG